MKYLVTGAGGQLGSEWVAYLKKNKLPFTALKSYELDITDAGLVEAILQHEKPGVIINCAAYTHVDRAEAEPEKAFLVNETGVKNLADACKKTGSKLVHFSTDYVFSGDIKDRNIYPEGYPEDARCNPVNVYGRTKRNGEIELQKSGNDYLLIRVSWLCGQFGSNFVKTMLRLSKEKDEVSVVDDQLGSPSFAGDVVEKTDRLINNENTGIFHISSRGLISWADFAEGIFSELNSKPHVHRISSSAYPVDAPRPAYSLLSNKKAEKAGLEPLNWQEGLHILLSKLTSVYN